MKAQEEREVEETNNRLDHEAWQDVQDYIKDCKVRKRMSLAARAKEKSRQRQWQQDEENKQKARERRDCRYRAIDRRHQELAQQEERRQKALFALKHAGSALTANPFAFLMD